MTSIEAQKVIRDTVHRFLPDARVILFGSQARGDQGQDSDFDVLVITGNLFEVRKKRDLQSAIHKALVYSLNAPVDVLLNSREEVLYKKELPGHVIRWALKEGIQL